MLPVSTLSPLEVPSGYKAEARAHEAEAGRNGEGPERVLQSQLKSKLRSMKVKRNRS